MESYLPLFYYICGFISAILCLSMLSLKGNKQEEVSNNSKNRKWKSIERLNWNFNMDFNFKNDINGNEIGIAVAEILKNNMQRNASLGEININPGKYSIAMAVSANFVKRE